MYAQYSFRFLETLRQILKLGRSIQRRNLERWVRHVRRQCEEKLMKEKIFVQPCFGNQ